MGDSYRERAVESLTLLVQPRLPLYLNFPDHILQATKQHGAAEARRAHNPEVDRSKLSAASDLIFFSFQRVIFILLILLHISDGSS